MNFDTEKLKQKANDSAKKVSELAEKEFTNFKEKQWPKIKDAAQETSDKTIDFSKKHGQEILTKSKKVFKDGVRALDQWVNGSSVHRDE